MKDSGIEWLGPVPADWKVLPVRALFKSSNTKGDTDDPHLTPSQKYGVLTQVDYMKKSGSRVVVTSGDSPNMKQVFPGDFISHLRSFQGGLELSKISGKVSGAYTVIRPIRNLAEDYFKWLFKSSAYVQGLQTTTDQLRDGQTIRMDQLSLLPLPYPEFSEQTMIASYLDQETSKIDLLISKKEQLIEKLLERRQALITQVVTKGLDPDVPMKDSGIEWIGELPIHWNIGKLSYFADVKLGKMVQNEKTVDAVEKLYFSAISVQNEKLIYPPNKRMWATPEEVTSLNLARGDLLVVEGGMAGATAVVEDEYEEVIFQNSLNRVRVNTSSVDCRFAAYWLNSLRYRGVIEAICNKATIMHLTREKLASLPLCLPPLETQENIARFLDSELYLLGSLIRQAEKSIGLLLERRQALITQVVTGKLDVRGFRDGDS